MLKLKKSQQKKDLRGMGSKATDIISWNVNGLKAIVFKGFSDFVKKQKAGIICIQEIKAQEKDFKTSLI